MNCQMVLIEMLNAQVKAEVVAAIKKLKKNKFPGVDKNSADEIGLQVAGQSDVDAIYRLCNKIWETENVGWLSLYQFTKK